MTTETIELCDFCRVRPATIRVKSKRVPGGRREGVDWSDAEVAWYCTNCYDALIFQQKDPPRRRRTERPATRTRARP